jgi:nicotinamide-nucleotide adenylyltransferase
MKKTIMGAFRINPLHKGHGWLISQLVEDFDNVIVCIGSTQEYGTIRNPFPFELRKLMLKNVYGDRIKIVPLTDIGLNKPSYEWTEYILDKLLKLNMPSPTHCAIGSAVDSVWYNHHFYDGIHDNILTNTVINNEPVKRKLVVFDRNTNNWISGTDIRMLIQHRDERWKEYVPAVNHQLIEENFPKNLLID